jgi:hypothetical protein
MPIARRRICISQFRRSGQREKGPRPLAAPSGGRADRSINHSRRTFLFYTAKELSSRALSRWTMQPASVATMEHVPRRRPPTGRVGDMPSTETGTITPIKVLRLFCRCAWRKSLRDDWIAPARSRSTRPILLVGQIARRSEFLGMKPHLVNKLFDSSEIVCAS